MVQYLYMVWWYWYQQYGTIPYQQVPYCWYWYWYLIRQTFITILNVKIISLDFHYPSLIFIWHKPNLCEKKETFIYVYKQMVYIYRSLPIYKNQSALVITLFIIICCDILHAFSFYFHSTVFDLLYKCIYFLDRIYYFGCIHFRCTNPTNMQQKAM